MGTEVLALLNNRTDHQLRTYAHCSASINNNAVVPRGLTVLLINLDSRPQSSMSMELPLMGSSDDIDTASSAAPVHAKVWVLNGPAGTNSSRVALNGQELSLDTATHKLPNMDGKVMKLEQSRSNSSMRILLPVLAPESIAFIELAGVGAAVGCPPLE
jgi:hypothetical protein